MASIPQQSKASGTFQGRWRWWYDAIADWLIRNPGGKLQDCATALNKHPNTISAIIHTDMFQEYLARRKEEFHKDHDYAIRSRLTAVAEASLDLMLGQLAKKGDQIPMQRLESLASTTLDRLGYGPQSAPAVAVNVTQDNRSQTVSIQGLTPQALEEARFALRQAEALKAGTSFPASSPRMPPERLDEPGADSSAVDGVFSDVDNSGKEGLDATSTED
jgi:hypothetical protein